MSLPLSQYAHPEALVAAIGEAGQQVHIFLVDEKPLVLLVDAIVQEAARPPALTSAPKVGPIGRTFNVTS